MTAVAHAISLQGVEGVPVAVEAHVGSGLVGTTIVGLGDTALREARERLRAALLSCQVAPLNRRLTVNLSPASLPKTGSGFDLAIAVSVLITRGLLRPEIAEGTVFAAELGLDGSLKSPGGSAALVWAAKKKGFVSALIPLDCWEECRRISGIRVVPCANLRHVIDAFGADETDTCARPAGAGWEHLATVAGTLAPSAVAATAEQVPGVDLSEVRGQPAARHSLLVAAVGGHHLLLHGEPGSGKTLLAERLGTVLPRLGDEEAMELEATYSAAGLERGNDNRLRPTVVLTPAATVASLLGGGTKRIRPGAVSLASGGVLVLNEAPDFSPRLLDSLRQPLESGAVTIRRSGLIVHFPARFQLVLTANPCPCGQQGAFGSCTCSPFQKRRYQQRLSGPLLDRIDIHQHMFHPSLADLETTPVMTSEYARGVVHEARGRSAARWAEYDWSLNAEVPGAFLRKQDSLPTAIRRLLDQRVDQGWLSLRAADRILRLAWSVADLEGHSKPTSEDFSLAMDLRTKTLWSDQ